MFYNLFWNYYCEKMDDCELVIGVFVIPIHKINFIFILREKRRKRGRRDKEKIKLY